MDNINGGQGPTIIYQGPRKNSFQSCMGCLFVVLAILAGLYVLGGLVRRTEGSDQEIAAMKQRAMSLDEQCRGYNHTPDDETCRARDEAYAELENLGVCWAYSDFDIAPPDFDWHDCRISRPVGK